MSQEDLDSLHRQLDDARENLRIIQESIAKYVRRTDVPPQLIKDERHWLDEIAELEQQLAARPVEDGKKRAPIDRTQVIIAVVAVAAIIGAYWLLVWEPSQSSSTSTPVPQRIEYVGRVLDAETEAPIHAAKVTLDFQGAPPIVYTDSEGIYRFTVTIGSDRLAGRVRIEADGYENYDRNITLVLNVPNTEDIRLKPLASTAIVTPIPLPVTSNQPPTLTLSGTVTPAIESAEMTFELYGSGLDGAEVTIQTSTGLTVMTIYIPQGTRQTVALPPGDYTYKVEAKGLVLPTPWPCWTTMERDSGKFSVRANANALVTIPIGQYEIHGCKPSPNNTAATTSTWCDDFNAGTIDTSKWGPPTDGNLIFERDGVLNLANSSPAQTTLGSDLQAIGLGRRIKEISLTLTLASNEGGNTGGAGLRVDLESGRDLYMYIGPGENAGGYPSEAEFQICRNPPCNPDNSNEYATYQSLFPIGTPTHVRVNWRGDRVEFYIDDVLQDHNLESESPQDPSSMMELLSRDHEPITQFGFTMYADPGSVFHATVDDLCVTYAGS
jgi:hypothetical protein